MNADPWTKPDYPEIAYVHDDSGRVCHYRPYWVGNVRDGHWEFAYWYAQQDEELQTWRYCGRQHN